MDFSCLKFEQSFQFLLFLLQEIIVILPKSTQNPLLIFTSSLETSHWRMYIAIVKNRLYIYLNNKYLM